MHVALVALAYSHAKFSMTIHEESVVNRSACKV